MKANKEIEVKEIPVEVIEPEPENKIVLKEAAPIDEKFLENLLVIHVR